MLWQVQVSLGKALKLPLTALPSVYECERKCVWMGESDLYCKIALSVSIRREKCYINTVNLPFNLNQRKQWVVECDNFRWSDWLCGMCWILISCASPHSTCQNRNSEQLLLVFYSVYSAVCTQTQSVSELLPLLFMIIWQHILCSPALAALSIVPSSFQPSL